MSAMNDHARLLSSAIATSRLRLLPFLVLMYVLAFIDRANVGYARAFLQADTGLGDAAFAFGASIFFIGYACFEVPSNLMLHRLGARVWLCRIMVTWGLVSAAMMFADDAMTFYVLRFLLGVAEAGFFPGIILYLTYWFPQRSRAQALGLFYFGLPLALVLGGPLSGWLLEFHGIFGLANWQWLFVTEGLLASLVGIAAYFYLVDRPRDAGWLSDEQKRALEGEPGRRRHPQTGTRPARLPQRPAQRPGAEVLPGLLHHPDERVRRGVLPADPHRQLPRRPGRPERRPDHRDSLGLRPGGNAPGDPPGRPQRPASPSSRWPCWAWPQPVSPPRRWPATWAWR